MSEDTVTITAEDVGVIILEGEDPIVAIDAELLDLTRTKQECRERGRVLTAERDKLVRERLLAKEQERLRGVLGEDVQIIRAGTVATG